MGDTLQATVRNGRLVMDEPTNLPEGTTFNLVVDSEDPFAKLTPEEREKLNAMIDEGREQIRNGEGIPAEEFLATL